MNEKYVFTIIIPIYNSELFLENCLKSIIDQSFEDFELILVDDGSTDKSFEICQAFQKKDNRIKLYQKENGGQGSARNIALKVSKGDYIMFVDSDDKIGPDTLLLNHQILIDNPNIECIQYPIYTNYGTKDEYIIKGKELLYNKKDNLLKLLLVKSTLTWIVCDKIFKKEVLKDLYFPEDMIYEDNYFILDLIERLNYVYISEKGMYYYYTRENSTVQSNVSLKREWSTGKVLMHTLSKIKLPEDNKLLLKYLVRLIDVNKSLRINFNTKIEGFHVFKKHVRLMDVINSKLTLKNKIKIFLYKYA